MKPLLYGRQHQIMLTADDTIPWPAGTAPDGELCAEPDRLVVMGSFKWDQLEGDEELSRIARFAAHLCETPSAAVSLVEAERQVFIAHEAMEVDETPRSTSLCAHAMLQGGVLEVRDCSKDPRFADFESVTGESHLRFYAGAPLISTEGAPLGALCVIDTEPRPEGITDLQREGLELLATSVKRRIEAHREAARSVSEIRSSAERLRFMLNSVPDIAWSATPGPKWDYFNARFTEVTGLPPRQTTEDWREVIHPDDFEASNAKFSHALKTASLFEDEWRLRQADGSYRWVISRAVPSTSDPATARWFGTLTDIDDRYRFSQERELLAGELAHRIKNIFSVITGLITLRARDTEEIKAFGKELAENVYALSRAQDYALRSESSGAEDLAELLKVLMEPYGMPGSDAVSISGGTIKASRAAATPLALIFHELATNSAKYGAFSVPDGRVAIEIEQTGEDIVVHWRESGGPAADPSPSQGFGTRLIEMTVGHQLNGSFERSWENGAMHVTLTIPRIRVEN
ncbi:sensor histidine kinase [Erythrobacter sp. YT30]|uniref:sensor histidine kinase n=1 Tax=Erythrobacter sp. YT30 TaxID=1735012 RepID=UPI00076DF09B|nr:PAS domain-containing protein [Erythrobacter sp. YT30]KWV91592.1 PAS domain S-box protein [Erythrobacter sp. YT30]